MYQEYHAFMEPVNRGGMYSEECLASSPEMVETPRFQAKQDVV